MTSLTLITRSPEETQRLGVLLGRNSQRGDLLLLMGALGTGKTTLVQGIAWGLGVEGYVRSPTFVLAHHYRGHLPLYHLDLYRVDHPQEAEDMDLDDFLTGDGVCVVEWGEKVLPLVPPDHLRVSLDYRGPQEREVRLEAGGPRSRSLLEAVARALAEERTGGTGH